MTLNPENLRQQFPALQQRRSDGLPPVFFDGPGGTQVPQSVIDAMADYLKGGNSNLLNSEFFAVRRTHDVVARARLAAAAFLNARPSEIVFGGSMTALTAHISRSIAAQWQPGDEIIVTELDHYANVSFWERAAHEKGAIVHKLPVIPDTCTLDHEAFERVISEKTVLVAFTMASNICGSLTDAGRLIRAAQHARALTFVDAVHYAPHFLPDVKALDCDFMTCSAYKFFGPHLGILYGKQEHLEAFSPYKVEPAADIVPDRWENGTKSFEALAGFAAAIDYLSFNNKNNNLREKLQASYDEIVSYERQWIYVFLERARTIPDLIIHGITEDAASRTPTFAITFKNRNVQAVSDHLARHNIMAGASHFYAKGVTDALGLTQSGGVLRVGAMHYTTMEELDRFFTALKKLF